MANNSKLTGIIVICVVALGAASALWWALQPAQVPRSDSSSTQAPSTSQESTRTDTSNHDATSTVVITYTNDGFTPTEPMVKKGGTVTVRNNSSRDLQFSSDPHPAHTGEAELNLPRLAPGKSTSFTVTRTGSFGFHDHLAEQYTGTLMVME